MPPTPRDLNRLRKLIREQPGLSRHQIGERRAR